jgi:hypothetical protein
MGNQHMVSPYWIHSFIHSFNIQQIFVEHLPEGGHYSIWNAANKTDNNSAFLELIF